MFGDRSPRSLAALLALVAVAGLTALGLAGCGGEKEVDPYVYASLRQVMDGDTLSDNFLFEIDAPRFEYVRGDLGVIRNGNRLEFLVATGLEQKHQSWNGALLGVQKFFSPTSHLVLRRLKVGGVVQPVDTVTTYTVPRIVRANAVDIETPGAPLPDVKWNVMSSVEQFVPKEDGDPISVQTGIENFVYAPRHDKPEEMAWYAVFPQSTFRIVDVDKGTDWMLHLLKDKGLPLAGSFSVTGVEQSARERVRVHGQLGHVVGTLKINWFRYANAFVRGA